MGEFNKKWFQVAWFFLLFASVFVTHMQRWIDAPWVHSAGVEMLGDILSWTTFIFSIVMFAWLCVGYWRTSRRLFWRKCRRWGSALLVGVIGAAVLVFLVRYFKGGADTISGDYKTLLIAIFAVGGFIWLVARYKFVHWRKNE